MGLVWSGLGFIPNFNIILGRRLYPNKTKTQLSSKLGLVFTGTEFGNNKVATLAIGGWILLIIQGWIWQFLPGSFLNNFPIFSLC